MRERERENYNWK